MLKVPTTTPCKKRVLASELGENSFTETGNDRGKQLQLETYHTQLHKEQNVNLIEKNFLF